MTPVSRDLKSVCYQEKTATTTLARSHCGDGCEHGGYPSELSLGEYADSPVDLGFSSLPNAHMVKLQGLYFHNFGDGHQSINSFSLPDLHTDLF